ncbi:MAG: membrane protein insertase YidC [Deltaproteobacteria bacterium]|nr:membrane protein insertase YidC [Deltaproteobacteria bacterium]
MEKRTIVAILLCLAIWLVWQHFFMEVPKPPARPDGGQPAAEAVDKSQEKKDHQAKAVETEPQTERLEEKLVSLRTELFEATFTTRGAALKSLKLLEFKERDENKKPEELGREDLVSTTDEPLLPLTLVFDPEKTSFKWPKVTDWAVEQEGKGFVRMRYQHPSDQNIPVITKTYRLSDQVYQLDVEVELHNRSGSSIDEQVGLSTFGSFQAPATTGCMGPPSAPRQPMCLAGEEKLEVDPKPGEASIGKPNVLWTGINEQYFLTAIIPIGVEESICKLEASHDKVLSSTLVYSDTVIPPGGAAKHRFRVYAGPKQMKIMEEVTGGKDGKRPAKLTTSVDYGWFSFLCHPMLWLLKVFYSVVGNYGLAIIFLTIVVKILLLPLTQKSMQSMREMAKLKPLMEDLKKRFGDDKQRLNQEMMNLYKTHKINPMGGCFPMLLQMPIWIALYRTLYSSVELYQAPFIPGWLDDLSYRDPYFIMPLVLGGTMFLQQKLSPTTADTQQAKMMMYMMPAFFTFIMLYLPSGLVLYIFVNSLLSIGHQLLYNRMKSVPSVAVEDRSPET